MLYCQTFTYPLTSGLSCYTSQQNFLDKNNNQNQIALYENWWNEQVQLYGMKVDYYTHGYSLSAHDALYGEHPLASFGTPTQIIALVDVSNDAHILSKFGITSTADITLIIPIRAFQQIFGPNVEPKSGDLIHLKEYGQDRPGGREGQVYEITERDDEAINQTNQLMGHYVWMIKGTRFDYSYERGAKLEAKMDQVSDSAITGITSSTVLPAGPAKIYSDSARADAKKNFDAKGNDIDTSVYGDY